VNKNVQRLLDQDEPVTNFATKIRESNKIKPTQEEYFEDKYCHCDAAGQMEIMDNDMVT
jgi:hypothetical protein